MIESGKPCANCGTPLHGAYCYECGQKATDINRPVWWIAGEFLDSVFSYDSRTLRTLWLLFLDPGEFTRLYNSGKRASVLPPFRTFIVATVVFFLALQMTGVALVRMVPKSIPLAGLDAEGRAALEAQLKREPGGRVDTKDTITSINFEMFVAPPPGGFAQELTAEQKAMLADIRKRAARDREANEGPDWMLKLVQRVTAGFEHAVADPVRFNGGVNIWLPRVMLILVPLFALLLALIHWRPRAYYIEHLILSLHLHTVLFIGLALVVGLVGFFGGNTLAWTVLPILGVYTYMAMVRVYGRSWWWTAIKFTGLMSVYGTMLGASLGVLFLLALSET